MLFTLRLLQRAVGDLVFLWKQGVNNYREYSAITTVWIFGVLSTNQFIYTIIGVVLMFIPSPNDKVQPATYLIAGSFLASSFIFDIVAFIVEARKQHLLEMILREEEKNAS